MGPCRCSAASPRPSWPSWARRPRSWAGRCDVTRASSSSCSAGGPHRATLNMTDHDGARTFDVAIAGAGLAGSSLAIRLLRSGARVALLDAHRFPRDKLCGEYVSPEGAAALERLGLGPDIARLGCRNVSEVRLSTPRGNVLSTGVACGDRRPGLSLSRRALDDLLVRTSEREGVAVLQGHRVAGPIVQDGLVIGLDARDASNRAVRVRATVVVAADGRHSTLVKRTGK